MYENPRTGQIVPGCLFYFLKRHSRAWMDMHKSCHIWYIKEQTCYKLEAHFCHISLYGLIFTLQTDAVLFQMMQKHTEECFLLSLTPTQLSQPKITLLLVLPNIISGSQLMNRCLSKHGHYNYQEVQPPSHSVESTWNSVPSSSSFWNTTKQNYTSSFISQEFNSMLLQTPGRPCSTM